MGGILFYQHTPLDELNTEAYLEPCKATKRDSLQKKLLKSILEDTPP